VTLLRTVEETRTYIRSKKLSGLKTGFVPTMGALHNGHESLIKRSVQENDCTVVSIFVNPIQFNNQSDLDTYPRTMERDRGICEEAGVTALFVPDEQEMSTASLLTHVDIQDLDNRLCGATRPGHFRGVCTIVTKLFNIVQPDRAYFGKKDIQQLLIIERMVRDLDIPVDVIGCDLVREPDGLAMSSRNVRLDSEQRLQATVLSRALKEAAVMVDGGVTDPKRVIASMVQTVKTAGGARIDYIEIVDRELKKVTKIEKGSIMALAVFFGDVRLIDNHITGDKICW
jgi:pantoate--beta-alanine ligase